MTLTNIANSTYPTKNQLHIDYDTKKLTERQRLIYELLPFGITKDDTKNEPITTARLARQFGKSSSTIKRDMKALQDLGLVTHIGPSNGGYWKRLK